MDTPTAAANVRYYRFLPYVAVLQTDLRQTPKNWVWRTWVFASVIAAVLYLTHRFAMYREAKFLQTVDKVVANLLNWTALGTVTLVVAFTSGAIATERGTLADAVLCRGISRYQYFLAKLHARLLAVLGTYLVMTLSLLGIAGFVFPGLLTVEGCAAALGSIGAILTAIVCFGVTTSAVCGSTVLSVSLLWVGLYSLGFFLTFLPDGYMTPDRLIDSVPRILRGVFDRTELWRLTLAALGTAAVATTAGLIRFSRSDV
jgi:ABC-2 type transport system permease protein